MLEDLKQILQDIKSFDIETPDDLYRVFTMCHLFSWAVIMYKMRNV